MSDFKKAAVLATALTAATQLAGCATASGIATKTGGEIVGDGAKEAVTQTRDACVENPDHAICKGTAAAGAVKDSVTSGLSSAKETAKEFSDAAGKKIGGFLSGIISGSKEEVDCSQDANKTNKVCQPAPANQ